MQTREAGSGRDRTGSRVDENASTDMNTNPGASVFTDGAARPIGAGELSLVKQETPPIRGIGPVQSPERDGRKSS